MASNRGFSIRIFVPSGEPEGLRVIEKSNWTGQGFVFPRSLLHEVCKRDELLRTGVYILWAVEESEQLPTVYIGESDRLSKRMKNHAQKKEFWTHVIAFTSKDQNLNKAYAQHLEARLYQLADEAKRCELDNDNKPQPPSLSEADTADAESYLDDLLLCLPIVGVGFFEKSKISPRREQRLFLKGRGIEATGYDGVEGFIVEAGSQTVKKEGSTAWPHTLRIRKNLLNKKVFKDEGAMYRLTQDYVFTSPSAAACVLLGRVANGRTDWKNARGKSLKEIQSEG